MSPLLVVFAAPVLFLVVGGFWVHAWGRLLGKHTLNDHRELYWPILQLLDSTRYSPRGKELLVVLKWSTAGLFLAYLWLVRWVLTLVAGR